MKHLSGMPVRGSASLNAIEKEILFCVTEYWPISPLEIASHLGFVEKERGGKRRLSSKFSYYLKKLSGRGLVFSKRIGNALIAWPMEAEKYRVVHEILSSEAPNA